VPRETETVRRIYKCSTSKYRKVVWQCYEQYRKKGKRACSLPYVKEEAVKQAFVDVYNGMVENKGNFVSILELSLVGGAKSDKIAAELYVHFCFP